MIPPPDDHTLNACLAQAIGIEVRDRLQDFILPKWVAVKTGEYWDPLQNASQMELVEAWLIKGHHIQYTKYVNQPKWGVSIWNDKGEIKGAGSDPDKKRAFALAIWEMEQVRKEK